MLMAVGGIGVGLWCMLSQDWSDDRRYIRRSKMFGTEEMVEGRDLNRNRQIAGGLMLLMGLYSSYCLVRRKAPFWAEVDYEPEFVHRVVPTMPAGMLEQGVSGRATIEFVVDVEGNVTEAKVWHASRPEFGEAALAAVRKWKFKPAIKRGRLKACRMRVPITFRGDRPFLGE